MRNKSKFVNTNKTLDNLVKKKQCSVKEFCKNGVSLHVQLGITFRDEQHLISGATKFLLTLSQCTKLDFLEEIFIRNGMIF